MGAESQAAVADNVQEFSGSDWRRGSKHPGRDRTEMTVDTDEPFVLDQDFEPAWAVLLHFQHYAGLDRPQRRAFGRREVEAEMKGAGFRVIANSARPEWRRDASRIHRLQQILLRN